MLHQLHRHLLAKSLSETFQSAYHAHHSTETALLDVTNCLLGNGDEGRVSILTLLDLLAAFDTLDHSILLARLYDTFGISDKAFEWFSSYLTYRFQSISVNGWVSSQYKLQYRVHQSPVWALFSLFCTPNHRLISFPKICAVTRSLLMTLSFSNHRLHLIFIH